MPKFNTTPEQFLNKITGLLKNMNTQVGETKINYAEEFSKNVGVWEGYTLKEHILLVLNQFSKYDFYDNAFFPDWIDKDSFSIMLALHDIGKPFAVVTSSKSDQSRYNTVFVKDIMLKLEILEAKMYSELVSEDVIGEYIKGHIDTNQATTIISEHAKECDLDKSKFYQLLKVYYMCDAGSYTADSGGQKSLDWIFIFDWKNRKILFSEIVNKKIIELNSKF